MAKMMVISSNTPQEDMEAAFTITKHAETDDNLRRIVWFSKIGGSIASIEERMVKLENRLQAALTHFETWIPDVKRRINEFDKDLAAWRDEVKKAAKEKK